MHILKMMLLKKNPRGGGGVELFWENQVDSFGSEIE